MIPQVISGTEDKRGNIHVEFMLAESGYLNDNDIGFTPQLLTKWHEDKAWEGMVHNAHPSKNHPLAYEKPPLDKSPLGQITYYRAKSANWGFATYVKTKLQDLANNQKRLNGIVRISEEGAKKAWREGKFPKYASSSVFIMERDQNTNLITDAVPIASTSVDRPAFPVDVAGIYGTCEGGEECVTKLAESGCDYCRHEVLTNFENVFSYQKNQDIKESSMSNETPSGESTGTPINKVSETMTSADGKKTETLFQSETVNVDWETKAKELESQLKDANKKIKGYEADKEETDKRFLKLEKDKLETKVRSIIEKIPLAVFDEKEENRESTVQKYLKMYPKMSEEEIMDIVNDRFMIAVKAAAPKKGLKESGRTEVTNDAPLKNSERKADVSIFALTEVFG